MPIEKFAEMISSNVTQFSSNRLPEVVVVVWVSMFTREGKKEEKRKEKFWVPSASGVILFLHVEVRVGRGPIRPSASVAGKIADERDEAIIFEHDQCCFKTLMRR